MQLLRKIRLSLTWQWGCLKQALLHAKSSPSIFQCHSFQQDIDSESEEEDLVGAHFDWTGDSRHEEQFSDRLEL